MSERPLLTEPVECFRCGKPIRVVDEGSGMAIEHDYVGCGYRWKEVEIIGDGNRSMGILLIVQNVRKYCLSPGYTKPYAGLTTNQAGEERE